MDKGFSAEILLDFIDNMPDLIYFKDLKSRFIFANKATVIDKGLKSVDELIGKTDFDFFSKELANIKYYDEQQIISTGIPMLDFEEYNHRRNSEKVLWVTSSKVPVKNKEDQIVGIMGISRDITDRKKMQEMISKQEVEIAHQSGKSEIVTDVLHNVGNVLNSIYVSAIEITELLSKSRLNGLEKANSLLAQHENELSVFLTADPKGKLLPGYYIKIGEELLEERKRIETEIQHQLKKISLIKDILEIQQKFAKTSLLIEKIRINEMVDSALLILQRAVQKNKITVIKKFSEEQSINASKSKFIHIVINLIKNAIESMHTMPLSNRTLIIEAQDDEEHTYIKFIDSGEGIEEENMNKIFNHGFTTKKSGNGFGLHVSANSMTEMKGKIMATSDGKGKGAEFTLVFQRS